MRKRIKIVCVFIAGLFFGICVLSNISTTIIGANNTNSEMDIFKNYYENELNYKDDNVEKFSNVINGNLYAYLKARCMRLIVWMVEIIYGFFHIFK